MFGFLLMALVLAGSVYLVAFKVYPAIFFRYAGRGERKARAEYQRIKREHPDAPEARISEAEFVENFVQQGPSPWKYVLATLALMAIGLPLSCVVGFVGMSN